MSHIPNSKKNQIFRELKRLLLIIDNFVPVQVKARLYTQSRYDDEQEEWTLTNVLSDDAPVRRPVSVPSRRRPVSEYALQKIKHNETDAMRYKGENIISYELDMPLRTTYDYKNPKVSAKLQDVLAEAMRTEDVIDITDQVRFDITCSAMQPLKNTFLNPHLKNSIKTTEMRFPAMRPIHHKKHNNCISLSFIYSNSLHFQCLVYFSFFLISPQLHNRNSNE